MPIVNVPGVTVGISAAVQMSASADGASETGASVTGGSLAMDGDAGDASPPVVEQAATRIAIKPSPHRRLVVCMVDAPPGDAERAECTGETAGGGPDAPKRRREEDRRRFGWV